MSDIYTKQRHAMDSTGLYLWIFSHRQIERVNIVKFMKKEKIRLGRPVDKYYLDQEDEDTRYELISIKVHKKPERLPNAIHTSTLWWPNK